MPAELLQTPEAGILAAEADEKVYNLIQLIYRAKNYEGNAKDYEFSRRTMEDHWRSGYNDAVRTLRHPEVLQRPNGSDGVFTIGAHSIWRSLLGGTAQSREPLLDMTGGRIIRGRGCQIEGLRDVDPDKDFLRHHHPIPFLQLRARALATVRA